MSGMTNREKAMECLSYNPDRTFNAEVSLRLIERALDNMVTIKSCSCEAYKAEIAELRSRLATLEEEAGKEEREK